MFYMYVFIKMIYVYYHRYLKNILLNVKRMPPTVNDTSFHLCMYVFLKTLHSPVFIFIFQSNRVGHCVRQLNRQTIGGNLCRVMTEFNRIRLHHHS